MVRVASFFVWRDFFLRRFKRCEGRSSWGCAGVRVPIFSSRTESAPTGLRVKSAGLQVLHNVLWGVFIGKKY